MDANAVTKTPRRDFSVPRGSIAARVLVTIAVVVGARVLGLIPLPGLDVDAARNALGDDGLPFSNLCIGAVGIQAFVSASVTVELAALVVPRWRGHRVSAKGRARLSRAALVLTALLAACQGFGIVAYSRGLGLVPEGWGYALVAMATVAAFSTALLWAADLVATFGVGHAVSLWIVIQILERGARPVSRHAPDVVEHLPILSLVLAAAAIAVWLLIRPPAPRDPGEPVPQVRLPALASGLPAWSLPLGVLLAAQTFRGFSEDWANSMPASGPNELGFAAATAGLGMLAAMVLTPAFHPHPELAAWEATLSNVDLAEARRRSGAELRRAARASAAIIGAIAYVPWAVASLAGAERASDWLWGVLDVGALATLVAVASDVGAELAGFAKHGDFTAIRAEHSPDVARAIALALRREGVSVVLRGLYHRSCLYLFGPYVPVSLLVPAGDAERASRLAAAFVERARAAAGDRPLPEPSEAAESTAAASKLG